MTLDEQLHDAARALRDVDPSACLVMPRVLRRVIKEHGEFAGLAIAVPHRKCYLIDVERLGWYVSPDELLPSTPVTTRAILIAYPDEEELQGMAQPQLLRELWRTLFHARVHAELESDLAVGRLSLEAVHLRINRLGQAVFDEAVAVLRQEHFLLSPDNLIASYIEFVAVWSELRYFDPSWLQSYFPAIDDTAQVDSLIAEDLDTDGLFEVTRPSGAALPGAPSAVILEPSVRRLLLSAEESGQRGNAVRAALLRNLAGTLAPPGYTAESLRRANAELESLCERLQSALQFADEARDGWQHSLFSLLANSRRGFWDADKRLLYDLQSVCIDHERELSVLDPFAWFFTFGRRPLKRPLPHLREVLIARHLRRAQRRLSASQLEDVDRDLLRDLLRESSEAAEDRMRQRFRPILGDALQDAGLLPQNLPERVALGKVVEELLDVIVERGFLTIGILRDALSRNNLKCPDFPAAPLPRPPGAAVDAARVPGGILDPASGSCPDDRQRKEVGPESNTAQKPVLEELRPARSSASQNAETEPSSAVSWIRRAGWALTRGFLALAGMAASTDPLLRIDARLATVMDGVYRRAETYLRVLQGLSAIAFGTRTGRFLTKYIVLPVGGAYVALMGLQHLVHLVQDYVLHIPHAAPEAGHGTAQAVSAAVTSGQAATAHATASDHHGDSLPNLYAWGGVSLFLFGMLHVPPFRTLILRHVLLSLYHVVKALVFDIPRWLLRLPWVHRIVFSRAMVLLRRLVVTPLAVTGLIWVLFPLFAAPLPRVWWFAGTYLLLALALNSRIGRDVEEVSTEVVGRIWWHIRMRILVALYELVMDTFKQIVESFERVLYAVDEWLRFRSGESSVQLAFKAILGAGWSGINYVLRFLINLIVEPQVNPIKHFPVVTVSHKMILPTQPLIAGLLTPAMGKVYGNTVALVIVTIIPGVFGFLVWELKENWRLFAANRRRTLSPVMIGHHGESLIRLMKPGLHSGTLPKLFARMRRAQRKSYLARSRAALTRYHDALHHLEVALRHFFERELVELINGSPSWDAPRLSVGHLHLASNSVRVEFTCPALHEDGLWLTFEEQNGWLLAEVSRTGWLRQLSPHALLTLETALRGVYKLAGTDLIREDIALQFHPQRYAYDIREQQLLIWPDPHFKSEVRYYFDERPARARPRMIARHFNLPDLDPQRLLFSRCAIFWNHWVGGWNAASTTSAPGPVMPEPPQVLPHPSLAVPRPSQKPPADEFPSVAGA